MILTQPKSTVTTSEEFQELEFGIRSSDMGLILDILRSKMYKNPIASICREIASNSRDANREAKIKKPIKIGIADHSFITTQMSIYFEDEGPGISPDRMADVFVNYGASTKRGSNVETGGFGLGAKTPFSYTDSFNILTRVNGTEYTYVAAIEGGKKGKIYLLNKKETDLPNGTTILIPIDEDDRIDFELAVVRATYFWEEPPIYENIRETDSDLSFIYNCDDYTIFENSSIFKDDFGVLIDGIYYELDQNSLNKSLDRFGSGKSVVFKFKTGQLTISANREALQYDNRTKYQIGKLINKFKDECAQKAYEVLNEAKTYIDKCYLLENLYRLSTADDYRVEMLKYARSAFKSINLDFTHEGKKYTFSLDKDMRDLRFYQYTRNPDLNTVSRTESMMLTKSFREGPIYLGDVPRVSTPKNRTIFKDKNSFYFVKVVHDYFYDWPELPFAQRKIRAKGMRDILNQLDLLKNSGLAVKVYSEVEKTKPPKVTTGKRQEHGKDKPYTIPVRAVTPSGRFSYKPISRTLKIENKRIYLGGTDITDHPKFYVPVLNLKDCWDRQPETELAKMVNLLDTKSDKKVLVILVNERRVKKLVPYIQSVQQFSKNIPDDLKQEIIDLTLMRKNREYDMEELCFSDKLPLDHFSFRSKLGNSAKKIWEQIQKKYKEKLKGAYSCTYIGESFRERVFGDMKDFIEKSIIYQSNKISDEFFSVFRLLKKYPGMRYYHSQEGINKDFQDYIDKVEELLMSKGELE
jgi:hypothetical protein